MKNLKEEKEGGKAKCCLCFVHENCGDDNEINKYKSVNKERYEEQKKCMYNKFNK